MLYSGPESSAPWHAQAYRPGGSGRGWKMSESELIFQKEIRRAEGGEDSQPPPPKFYFSV